MKNILDNLPQISELDQSHMLESIELIPDQLNEIWAQIQALPAYEPPQTIHHIVIAGLGGSALGADIAKSCFKQELNIPIEICRDYTLPRHVGPHTLVILASYSGTTEETRSCISKLLETQAQVMALATGGGIIDFAQKNNFPYIQFDPISCPCGQARIGIGYSILGTLGLLKLAGAINFSENQFKEVSITILAQDKLLHQSVQTADNPAKLLALQLVDRKPILIAADFLEGATHTATNFINENSKYLADYKIVPEMNHHWLEGLEYPLSNRHDHIFLIIKSNLNHPRNQARLRLNEQLLQEDDFDLLNIDLETDTKITQSFELISLFLYTSFYLAILMGIDPSPTPHVNWLKQNLGEFKLNS